MPIIEIDAEIDLNTYAPDLTYTVADLDGMGLLPWREYVGEMKKLAVRLARYGDTEGNKYKGARIINVIRSTFPSNIAKLPSRTSVENWIEGVEYIKDEDAYSPDSVPRQWRSYVARLSMISEFWHLRPLSGNEAKEAQWVGSEFQDPFGEEVDLFPQLAMVREITKYAQLKYDMSLFEDYFKFAPWKFGRELMGRKIFSSPLLTDFMMHMQPVANWKDVSPVFEDALSQLGLPYTASYFPFGHGTSLRIELHDFFPTQPHYGNAAKGACNWQTILKSRTAEEQAELMELMTVLDLDKRILDELAQHSWSADGLVSGDLRPWMKKHKWKKIERITYTEANDD